MNLQKNMEPVDSPVSWCSSMTGATGRMAAAMKLASVGEMEAKCTVR